VPVALGYAHDPFGYTNKLTYITPVFNGFQAGVSYTPTLGIPNLPIVSALGLAGVALVDQGGIAAAQTDNDEDEFENGWEIAARYEGSFDTFDVALGAGYSHASLENDNDGVAPAPTFDDDFHMWNVGANVGIGAFGIGTSYLATNNGIDSDANYKSWVAGVDYTTGPYKLGLSYLNGKQENGAGVSETEADRWTAGAIYEWGPGMTFRGAVQWQQIEDVAGVATDDLDGTQFTIGTQLNF
jgi:outer membrane protein OmpU